MVWASQQAKRRTLFAEIAHQKLYPVCFHQGVAALAAAAAVDLLK